MLVFAQATTGLVLSEHHVKDVGIGLGTLALIIVLLPALLAFIYAWKRPKDAAGQGAASFFEIPYITWFLVHYGVASLAIIAIVFLAIDNVIDKGTVSALLGSLFGYVLGSAARPSRPAQDSQTVPSSSGGSGGATDQQASARRQ